MLGGGGVRCPSAKLICLSPFPDRALSPAPQLRPEPGKKASVRAVPPGREPALELGTERRASSRDFAGPLFFSLKYKDVQFFWFQFSIGEFYNLVIKISDRL